MRNRVLVSVMSLWLLAVASLWAGRVGAVEPIQARAAIARQDETRNERAAQALVQEYFTAYQAGAATTLRGLFDADARIVRYDGQQIDVALLLRGLRDLPPSSTRPEFATGNFEFVDGGAVLVVSFDLLGYSDGTGLSGHVAGEAYALYKFRASWFLVPSAKGYRIAWTVDVPYGADDGAPTTIHPAASAGLRPRMAGVDEAAAEFVEHFFRLMTPALQERSRALFLPKAKIVHSQGNETSIGEFLGTETAAWPHVPKPQGARPARPPPFDHITTRHFGDCVLIAYDNHVTHWREGHGQSNLEHAYRENWLLKETKDGLKAQWVIYAEYGGVPVPVGHEEN